MPSAAPIPTQLAQGMLARVLWAERVIGNAPIGAALIYAYFIDGRFRSAIEIAKLAKVSEDTARRQLTKLARIGRVEERVENRARVFRIDPALAQRAVDMCISATVPH